MAKPGGCVLFLYAASAHRSQLQNLNTELGRTEQPAAVLSCALIGLH